MTDRCTHHWIGVAPLDGTPLPNSPAALAIAAAAATSEPHRITFRCSGCGATQEREASYMALKARGAVAAVRFGDLPMTPSELGRHIQATHQAEREYHAVVAPGPRQRLQR